MQFSKITGFLVDHATQALAAVLPGDLAADKALSEYFRANPKLGAYERRFSAEVVYTVIRNRRSLSAMAERHHPRALVLAALARFSGFNTRQFETIAKPPELEMIARVKAQQAADLDLAVRLDLPDWLCERLVAQEGEANAAVLALALNQAAPLDLRVNTIKATRDEVLARLRDGEFAYPCEPTPYAPQGVRLAEKPALAKHPLFVSGAIEVQDEGSQLLCALTNPKRGEMVADFCAGAGGKTLALGAMMRSTGRLYAFDVSEGRLKKFGPRLKRSGLSNVHPVRIDNENDLKVKRLADKMDRVLVDAPCSGLGTLRRNPELKWRQQPNDIVELAAKQLRILEGASRLVKPGGVLVYATCSILNDENQAVVEQFLARRPEFAQRSAPEALAAMGVDLPHQSGPALVLRPHLHGTDGFFAALLVRQT